MTPSNSRSAVVLGLWSSALAGLFSVVYVLFQLAEWAGWLGSAGGPESASTNFGLVLLLTPSLLLGASFLATMVAVYGITPAKTRVHGLLAVQFATVYAVLTGMVYYVQLTLVAPRMAEGRTSDIQPFLFVPFDSFFYSVDLLGYSFMSLSTLFAGLALRGPGIRRWARLFLIANGCLLPFLALQIYFHVLIWPASLWVVSFPAAMVSLFLVFLRDLSDTN